MNQRHLADMPFSEHNPDLESFTRQIAIDVDTRVFTGKDYYMKSETAELGNIKACMISTGPHEAYVKGRNNSAINKNAWTLVLQLEGEVMMESDELSLKLSEGDWKLHQAPQNFKVWCLGPMKQLVMKIPDCEISRLKCFITGTLAGPLNNRNKMGKIFFDFVLSSFKEAAGLGQQTREDLAQMILQLLVFTLSESAGPRQMMSSQDLQRERIKLIITRRFTDPAFSIDEIAANLNCSKRYLHMVFRATPDEESLGNFILSTRLEKIKSELAKAQNKNTPIAQIAQSCGFHDASYFSKIFKQRVKMSPSEYRSQTLTASH